MPHSDSPAARHVSRGDGLMCRSQLNFGGIRIPDRTEPPPGPLARLAKEAAASTPALSVTAKRMLEDLPPHLSTRALIERNPEVVERLARLWSDRVALRRLFDDLMFETERANSRMGFEAIIELTELKDYFMRSRYGERASVWDEALGLA